MLEDGTLLSGGGAEIKAWDSMNYFKRVKERTVGYITTYIFFLYSFVPPECTLWSLLCIIGRGTGLA